MAAAGTAGFPVNRRFCLRNTGILVSWQLEGFLDET
jgi:hypothetical protein